MDKGSGPNLVAEFFFNPTWTLHAKKCFFIKLRGANKKLVSSESVIFIHIQYN